MTSGAGSYFPGLLFRLRCGFRGSVSVSLSLNGAANLDRDVLGNGARVSFFLRDAEAWEKVNNGLRFDFELAGQLVDSDLIGFGHALRLRHLVLRILLFVIFRKLCWLGARFGFLCRGLWRFRWRCFGSGVRGCGFDAFGLVLSGFIRHGFIGRGFIGGTFAGFGGGFGWSRTG